MLCTIYKSSKMEFAYLYVRRGDELKDLPDALMGSFGDLEKVMDLVLDDKRKLARASADEVIESIESQGFYLQMPPGPESELRQFLRG